MLSILAAFIFSAHLDTDDELVAHVVEAFERSGRATPEIDSHLNDAALTLAQQALNSSTLKDVILRDSPLEALSKAGASDAGARVILVRASSQEEAIQAFRHRQDLTAEPASHFGLAVVSTNKVSSLVAILSDRKATLKGVRPVWPLPQQSVTLCLELRGDFHSPELHITRPEGTVEFSSFVSTRLKGHRALCAKTSLQKRGIYTLEVTARSRKGPEVVALYRTSVGEQLSLNGQSNPVDSSFFGDASTMILKEINLLRKKHQLKDLRPDAALEAIATAYAAKMVNEIFFGHVAPDGTDMARRLQLAKYQHEAAAENLGVASDLLSAHQAIIGSPAHRREILNAAYSNVGIGVATRRSQGRDEVIVVELLARPR